MITAMISIPEEANQILNIVKARYNLQNKSQAIAKIIIEHGNDILEPKIRPEFIKELKEIEKKGYSHRKVYSSINELMADIEGN